MDLSPRPESSRGSVLRGPELMAFGKSIVTGRLESVGCTVTQPSNLNDGRLEVRTGAGRALEVFVSTQRVGGYSMWTKRRLEPAEHRLAAIVLLSDRPQPDLFLIPSVEWRNRSPPLTDRDYEGQKSEPEWGVELGNPSALRRYAWDETATSVFG